MLLLGGIFLRFKASHEIFVEVKAREENGPPGAVDIVFSLDLVITAVGMVNQLPVMVEFLNIRSRAKRRVKFQAKNTTIAL